MRWFQVTYLSIMYSNFVRIFWIRWRLKNNLVAIWEFLSKVRLSNNWQVYLMLEKNLINLKEASLMSLCLSDFKEVVRQPLVQKLHIITKRKVGKWDLCVLILSEQVLLINLSKMLPKLKSLSMVAMFKLILLQLQKKESLLLKKQEWRL